MDAQEFETLKTFISQQLAGNQAIDDQTPLFSSRLVNSRNLMHLVDFLERQFQIRFSPVDMSLANLDTLDAMRVFVTGKRNKNAA